MEDRRVTYIPPSDTVVHQLAKAVCTRLAASHDELFLNPHIVAGFSNFLTFTTKLIAKYLTAGRDELLDKRNSQR